ncbi:serine/threonine protein kinase [Wenzhouxiangella sp. XN79A]|uniref:serine/threonine-protein kinase n=1 Tax=Wenzhouxiangella sp. XN79A TaxID=2724193 RepID=UPI00144A9630|nr:serine/threonine-protein kinase [Wenzhouxiangella sp. XN79A]NKI34679.1 serine/threonine protein kinase [Wenzhouxiangella sp. XN79A]
MPRTTRPGRLTPARRQRIDALLDHLLDLDGPTCDRELAALAERCPRLHAHAARLVEASTAPTDYLRTLFERVGRRALPDAGAECNLPAGTRIGGWRLIEAIGAGGMGLVYRAERADGAFEMQVALKLIRRLDPVLGRQLDVERGLLARLDHPNIARLIDGGATEDGWAWLAMEWIDGIDAGQWAGGEHPPSVPERLRVFGQLAEAVAQAHRRRIVHGDIKPSNVRIASDGRPRLLDFGIARLVGDEPDDPDALSALTPAFAAPEQKRGEPITPQSDVFALGALLYWLLTRGTLTEDDAETRRHRLAAIHPRGDELHALVTRATDDDPDRRYNGVAGLLADLEAFGSQRPLEAMPARRSYVLARFLQRNRAGVTLAGLVLLLLVGSVTGIAWQGRIAIAERDRAEVEARTAEQVTGFLVELFEQADPDQAQGRVLTAQELVERGSERVAELDDEPRVQTRVLGTLGRVQHALGDYEAAEPLLRRALAQADADPAAQPLLAAELRLRLGDLLYSAGRYPDARALTEAALELLPEGASTERADTLNTLGNIAYAEGDFELSERYYAEALAMHAALEPGGTGEANSRLDYGAVFAIRDRHEEAEKHFRQAWTLRRELHGENHPATVSALYRVADSQMSMGEFDAAESNYRTVVERYRTIYGPVHPRTAGALHSLGILKLRQGQLSAAEPLWREALAIRREVLDPGHPDIGASLNALTFVLRSRGELEEAYSILLEVLEIARTRFGDPHYTVASTLYNLGILALELDRLDEAEQRLRAAHAMRRELLGDVHSEVAISQEGLARLARARGEYEAAEDWAKQALATVAAVHGRDDHPEADSSRTLLRDIRAERAERSDDG